MLEKNLGSIDWFYEKTLFYMVYTLTACDDEYLKCIEVICNNDFTNIECFGECMESFDNCEAKCPCKIGGECESGCPCPSYRCEPVCEDSDDLERSQVNSKCRLIMRRPGVNTVTKN